MKYWIMPSAKVDADLAAEDLCARERQSHQTLECPLTAFAQKYGHTPQHCKHDVQRSHSRRRLVETVIQAAIASVRRVRDSKVDRGRLLCQHLLGAQIQSAQEAIARLFIKGGQFDGHGQVVQQCGGHARGH